jgi:6-phosphofructokinase 1
MKKIAVLTSGGDVPGLNACIKAIVTGAEDHGWQVIGIKRGWMGLLAYDFDADPEKNAALHRDLTSEDVRGIENFGGTILHTSRFNPKRIFDANLPDFLRGKVPASANAAGAWDCTDHILKVLEALEIDLIIPIGGDGSLRFAAHLHSKDFPVISIPKTMDNDVFGTDYCIGFSTCVTRCVDSINKIRTTAASHERVAIIELFGRYSGEPALIAGHIASADRVLIPEVPVDFDVFKELITRDRKDNPQNYALIVVAEGAYLKESDIIYGGEKDITGRKKLGGIGKLLTNEIRDQAKLPCLNQSLAYLLRSGEPDALDKLVATNFGMMAIQLINEKKWGKMTAIVDGNYALMDAGRVIEGTKRIDIDTMYDRSAYRPKITNILGRPMYL